MSEALTQEEIDEILKGSRIEDEEIDEEAQALLELGNIGINALSDVFLEKLNKKTSVQALEVTYINDSGSAFFEKPIMAFRFELHGGVQDKTIFYFEMDDVDSINALLLDNDGEISKDLGDMKRDVLLSIILNFASGYTKKMSTVLGCEITVDTPEIIPNEENYIKTLLQRIKLARVKYELEVGNELKCYFYQLYPLSFVSRAVQLLLSSVTETAQVEKQASRGVNKCVKKTEKTNPVTFQTVNFPSFGNDKEIQGFEENIDFILDVPLRITVELGSTEKPIKDILSLNVGSIIELDNLAEELVEILVNGKLIARGEVIVVDENFGVRIRELYTNNQKNLFNEALE